MLLLRKRSRQDYNDIQVMMAGGVGIDTFKGSLVKEIAPDEKEARGRRFLLKLMPLSSIITIGILVYVWWVIDFFNEFSMAWPILILLVLMEVLGYLFIDYLFHPTIVPINFYSNGIDIKPSLIERMAKVHSFTEKMTIDRFKFYKAYQTNDASISNIIAVDAILRNGKTTRLGNHGHETAILMRDIIERTYGMQVDWPDEQGKTPAAVAKTDQEAPSSFCIQCGSKIEEGSSFCTVCGGKQP